MKMQMQIQETIRVMVRIKPPAWYSVYRDSANFKVLHCGEKTYGLDHIFTT